MSRSLLIDRSNSAGPAIADDCEANELDSPGIRGFRTVLLVESRDDVFSCLAAVFVTAGLRVARAKSPTEAIRRYVRNPAGLLVVNADQPNQSAWLLAAKLRLTHPVACIWVYSRHPSTSDVGVANFLMIDELIDFEGDLSCLTDEVFHRLCDSNLREAQPTGDRDRTTSVHAVA